MKRLKIAYYCVNDPLDKRSWSGITYYLGQGLQRNVGDVDFLGPVTAPPLLEKTMRAMAKFIRIVFKKEYDTKRSVLFAWYASRELKRRMKGKDYDCVVAPAASTEFALFRSRIPSVYVSDATYKLIVDFYVWEFAKTPGISRLEGNWLERRSMHNADFLVLSSEWAARSAVADYGIDAGKVVVQPLGANMDFAPPRDIIFHKEENKTLTLLWLAVDWHRKGGSLALETLRNLRERGVKAKLIVCGCVPPDGIADPDMEVIPFLNKNITADHERFVHLLSTSHFLLLPTRADCSLLVGCESNAYGMPVIATKTGGVPNLIRDGINGYCLPMEARGSDYATTILEIFNDKPRYHELIRSSRAEYELRLNWDRWAERFASEFRSRILGEKEAGRKEIATGAAV